MSAALAIVGQVLAVAGTVVLVLAGVGLLRFGDVYMRTSSVATATGVGITLVLLGALLVAPGVADAAKVAVAVVLQLVTSAIAGIALGRSALLSRHRFRSDTDTAALTPTPRGDDGDS